MCYALITTCINQYGSSHHGGNNPYQEFFKSYCTLDYFQYFLILTSMRLNFQYCVYIFPTHCNIGHR